MLFAQSNNRLQATARQPPRLSLSVRAQGESVQFHATHVSASAREDYYLIQIESESEEGQ